MREGTRWFSIDLVFATVLVMLLAVIAGPIVIGAVRAALSPSTTQPAPLIDVPTLARTLALPLLIGLISTALAWPVAWSLRAGAQGRWGSLLTPVMLCPLLLPNYLAYTGWSSIRSPGTWLGGVLERAGPATSIFAGQVIAILALALWAWPIAAAVVLAGLRRIEPATVDALRQIASPARVQWQMLAMTRGPVLSAIALVALVMLGSPVPMHLAQLETLGIKVLQSLAQSAGPGDAWRASWPVVMVAIIAALTITSRLNRWTPAAVRQDSWPAASRAALVVALAILALSVLVPMGLSGATLHSTGPIVALWRDSARTLASSAGLAASTGAIVLMLTLVTWIALSVRVRPHRFAQLAARVGAAVMLTLALVPGVLVGSAIKSFANWPALGGFSDWLVSSPAIVVWAHVARFGFLGVVGGWWLSTLEPVALADARRLAGGESLAGWARAVMPLALAPALALALAGSALSLHEIEASIQVVPPAAHPYLAQQLLDALHYLYLEQIAAANVSLGAVGLAMALLTGWLLWSRSDRRNEGLPKSH
jgi:ABC-type Fe3+ transport system permease subunit